MLSADAYRVLTGGTGVLGLVIRLFARDRFIRAASVPWQSDGVPNSPAPLNAFQGQGGLDVGYPEAHRSG